MLDARALYDKHKSTHHGTGSAFVVVLPHIHARYVLAGWLAVGIHRNHVMYSRPSRGKQKRFMDCKESAKLFCSRSCTSEALHLVSTRWLGWPSRWALLSLRPSLLSCLVLIREGGDLIDPVMEPHSATEGSPQAALGRLGIDPHSASLLRVLVAIQARRGRGVCCPAPRRPRRVPLPLPLPNHMSTIATMRHCENATIAKLRCRPARA